MGRVEAELEWLEKLLGRELGGVVGSEDKDPGYKLGLDEHPI